MVVGCCGVIGVCGCDEQRVDPVGGGVVLGAWVLDLSGRVGAAGW